MLTFLIILAFVIVLVGLIYTLKINKEVAVRKSANDPRLEGEFRKHPFLLNPVFLAYIIGLGALLIFIGYLTIA